MTGDGRRLIEVAFPLEQVSLDSVHEKNVRHGHISTLHIWPARRPLPDFVRGDRDFMEAFLKARGFKGKALARQLEKLGLVTDDGEVELALQAPASGGRPFEQPAATPRSGVRTTSGWAPAR